MVVEDDIITATGIADLLAARGHEVEVVCNGEGALSRMRVKTPDAVVVDQFMPAMTGLEMLTRMRNSDVPAKRGVKALFLTAAAGEDLAKLREALQTLGPVKLLCKPAPPSQIVEEAESLLRPQPNLSP